MTARLLSLFQVRSGEVRMVALVAALFACIQAGQGIGANAADALFFLRFGVDYLPYMFMALGVLTSFSGLAYATGMGRFDQGAYLRALLFGAAVLLLVERAAISMNLLTGGAANDPAGGSPALYPILWLTVNVYSVLLTILVWNVAGQVCDARQAKRLFSLFASAGILGGILGNLLTGLLAQVLETENLLVLYAGLLLIGFWLMRKIARQFFRHEPKAARATSVWDDLRVGFDVVRNSRLMLLIAFASVLFSILFFSMSFPFSKVVSASFPNEAAVAGFLGLFWSVITATAFVISLLIANRLYARVGVAIAGLVLPVVYLIGFVLWMINFNLVTAVVARAVQMIVLFGIANSAWNAFFNVIPLGKRSQVQTFEMAVPSQIGVITSGVLLVLGERVLNTTQIFAMGMVTAVLCGILLWQMRTEYSAALIGALRTGLADVFTEAPRGFDNLCTDARARQTVLAGLDDPKPTVRRASAEILGKLQVHEAVEPLVHALHDLDAEVRSAALGALVLLHASDATQPIAACLNDPVPAVRANAINALSALAADSAPRWTHLLYDPDPTVRGRTVVAFCRLGNDKEAHTALSSLLGSPDPVFRIQGLNSIAECHDGVDPSRVADLMKDESAGVRVAAVQALGSLADNNKGIAVSSLLGALEDPDERVRCAAGEALQPIENSSAALLESLEKGSERAQDAVLVALQNRPRPVREAAVNWALTQVPRAAQYRAWTTALDNVDGDGISSISFLRDLLREREWQTEQRILRALALTASVEDIHLIERGVKSRHPEERAQALEALDTLGNQRVARAVLPLLENGTVAAQEESRAVLEKLTSHPDPWLRALATHAMGEMFSRNFETLMRRAKQDPSPIVRQVAGEAIHAVPASMGETMADSVKTLGTMDRILFLRQVPIFSRLTPEDLSQIAELTSERVFEDGDYVCREGELGDELFVIVEGQVSVVKQSDGTVRTLRHLQTGEQIGELAILREQPRSASVIADKSHVRALVLRGEALHSILRDRPQVALAMLSSLADRLSTVN